MDITLLKKVAQYIMGNLKVPVKLEGYSDADVKNAVDTMVKDGVVTFGKATKYSPGDGNYTLREGSAIPLGDGVKIDVTNISEYKFEKCYGEKMF